VYNMGLLELPPEKGPVDEQWDTYAKQGVLEAMIDPAGNADNPKMALKQARPATDELKNIWLQKVGWTKDNEEANWKSIVKPTDTFRKTLTANGNPCQVDHILELQFGGNNVPANLQMLDGSENMSSGSQIFADLKSKAIEIRAILKKRRQDPEFIVLHYDGAKTKGKATCLDCCKADAKATQVRDVGPKESVSGATGEPYPLVAGGPPASLLIPKEIFKDKKQPVAIAESTIPENRSASTLIPGLSLQTLNRSGKPDKIKAGIDEKSKTRLPVTLDGTQAFDLNVGAGGKLSLPTKNPHLKFHYPYLSSGEITHLELMEDGTVSGRGTMKPTIPFLPQIDVKFDKDTFAIVAPIPKEKLRPPLPIPGLKITDGEIGLELAPEFKPYGKIAFALTPGGKKFMDAALDVSGDASGLVASGTMHAYIPGIDAAEGKITYQNKEWTGGVTIDASQLQPKLKYVKSGSAVVGFSKNGIEAAGTIILAIPGADDVSATLMYHGGKWLFKGKGQFKPPKLDPVEIEIEYDGNHIYGQAETGFKFHGLNGKILVRYADGKFAGEGKIDINKGKARGSMHVKISPAHKFSGEGEITYQITEKLAATAGIIIDEEEKVTLKGALEFTKPIPLFEPFKGDYKIFDIGIKIPIPGASIGPVGLNAKIVAALNAGYKIGPGELRNAKIEGSINPLEDKPDIDLQLSAQLYIGAHVYVSGTIGGRIEVDVGVASLEGGLDIIATASLDGEFTADAHVHYTQSKLEADANFKVLLALALTLALDAVVKGEIGVSILSYSKEKRWHLAAFTYNPGLQLGMKLKKPIHYATGEGIQFPSADDIDWILPKIEPAHVLESAFSGGGTEKARE